MYGNIYEAGEKNYVIKRLTRMKPASQFLIKSIQGMRSQGNNPVSLWEMGIVFDEIAGKNDNKEETIEVCDQGEGNNGAINFIDVTKLERNSLELELNRDRTIVEENNR